MSQKIKIILTALLVAHIANAAEIFPLKESFWQKVGRCNINIFCYFRQNLGATITTINATDLISDSRSTINTNFSNLNSDKMEKATTTLYEVTTANSITSATGLVSIGTITTGTWNATAIGVAYGGTGTTSPAQYQVILGNGSLGLTVASSTGTSGQTLQSNGANAYPSWADNTTSQSANYTWTGNHTFSNGLVSASTTIIQSLNATSSRLQINGVSYNAATSTLTATSTLVINSRNSMFWESGPVKLFDVSLQAASSTFGTYDFEAKNGLRVILQSAGLASAGTIGIQFNRDTGTNYTFRTFNNLDTSGGNEGLAQASISIVPQATTSPATFTIDIPNITGTAKLVTYNGNVSAATALPFVVRGSGNWNNTSAQITQITFTSGVNFNANTRLTVFGY